jgi:hypothetical protein
VSEVTRPPPPRRVASTPTPAETSSLQKRRAFEGWGAAVGGFLAALAGALIKVTGKLFGQVRTRAGASMADFRARPEHSRWRAYALGGYGLLVAGTLAGQFWTENPLGVYVKVQQVEMPKSTYIFVRNESRQPWRGARLTLNGVYLYERPEILPGDNLRLEPQAFTVMDSISGKLNKFPRNARLESLALDCDRGHFETVLKP